MFIKSVWALQQPWHQYPHFTDEKTDIEGSQYILEAEFEPKSTWLQAQHSRLTACYTRFLTPNPLHFLLVHCIGSRKKLQVEHDDATLAD